MKLKDKKAVVTGASSGIGKATAIKLCQEGAEIAICDIDFGRASELANQLSEKGKKTIPFKMDVSDFKEVEETVASIEDQFKGIDILVNSAGIVRAAMFHKMTEQQWDEVNAIHLKGTFNTCRHIVPVMRKQQFGKIINISSTSYMGNIGQANYAAAKAGIIALTKTIALELARYNVNANVIAPGPVDTPMYDQTPEKIKKMIIEGVPLKRMADPNEIADLIAFLASEASTYITGELIHIDGGMTVGE